MRLSEAQREAPTVYQSRRALKAEGQPQEVTLTAPHAASCTARHGVSATPNPAPASGSPV